jgi:2-polyprenyl-6-hydroxyphenyl methylase / 3-demethylubiquinone-9 3-methyltransferase
VAAAFFRGFRRICAAEPAPGNESGTVDPADVARFAAGAGAWWDADGPFAPLHKFNPARLGFIRREAARLLHLDQGKARPFDGLAVLDVGCGGGLLAEPLSRLGARVTGIDASEPGLTVARDHAQAAGLAIEYRAIAAEALAAEGRVFDMVVASEVIEHVADRALFAASLAALVRPGGVLVLTTLNRTAASLLLGKVAAEYLLGWVPRGTHDWRKFMRPGELEALFLGHGVRMEAFTGFVYDPLTDSFRESVNDRINYAVAGIRD